MWSPLPDPDADGPAPVPLSSELDALMMHLGAPPVDAVRALNERWTEVVGADVADHVRLAGIDHGTVLLEVDAPAWATRMRFGTGALLTAIEHQIGLDVASRVEVQVRPRHSRSGRPGTPPRS